MRFAAQTINGMEDISSIEIEELIDAKSEKLCEGRLSFKTAEQKAKELAYATRSLLKIYEMLQDFEFKDFDDLLKKAKVPEIKGTFVVRCQRDGEHQFQSLDVEKNFGEKIFKKGNKVDLKNPDTTIVADIIGNRCLIGRDLTPKAYLSRRDYRIKAHPKSINACLAYDAVRLSGWTKDKTLLDPSCKDGVIPIEAALWASGVPRGYFENTEHYEAVDKKMSKGKLRITAADTLLPNVRSAEVNSKLAEINKQIDFTKIDFDWLDIKFKKESVDIIITTLTDKSDKLFERAEYILAKDGKILILAQSPKQISPRKLKLKSKREARLNQTTYSLITYGR